MQAITVYCSSSSSLEPAFHRPARELGIALAQRGVTLVYGGGSVGLMGEIARATKDHGGTVIGIITRTLMEREVGFEPCDELVVVDTMRERKRLLIERADGFIVLPGGIGTYEEFFEVLVARVLDEHQCPIGIVNIDGYYDPMLEMLRHGIEHQFIRPAAIELLQVDVDPLAVLDRVQDAEITALDPADVMPAHGGTSTGSRRP